MQTVKEVFTQRVSEIEKYYTFINTYISTNSDKDLNKILRSNLIIMLYNLVESSVSNSIEQIHNSIHSNRISFDALNTELKKILVRHLKKSNPHDFVTSINSIALDIVKQSFNKKQISDGNIDNETISKLGNQYGFCTKTSYTSTKSGKCLKDIKGRRNDLAHGIFSFTEIGKEYTIEDLACMKDESINYLREIINNIELYIINETYKLRTNCT